MMLMIWIFILAGAFANTAKTMGAIDATVNLTLTLLPANMLLAGLFIAACFISISIGTSVGTIVALTPIASGIAAHTGIDLPMIVAIVVEALSSVTISRSSLTRQSWRPPHRDVV